MSPSSPYDKADQIEKNNGPKHHLERLHTIGGHENDRSQPALPVVHRTFANPAPLGLLSLATGIFLIAMFGVHARGTETPNILIGVVMFFGGVCQFISGIMEFVAGNTFGATVFPAYGAFNLSYGMIFLPGTGIIAAYTDPATGKLNDQFHDALAFYLWSWFILSIVFTIAAMRSSWILFLDLVALDIALMLLACGYMLDMPSLLTAGNGFAFVVAFLSYWAGCAGLWAGDITPIRIPTFAMYKEQSSISRLNSAEASE